LVAACTSHDPASLKPNPYLIDEAARFLGAQPGASTLVGDSITDIEVARRAKMAIIGYANKLGKRENMIELRAGTVIASMVDLTLAIRAHRVKSEL
jgi:beta-phosphoglucomutase-like phosphatase (HAD superfamily)